MSNEKNNKIKIDLLTIYRNYLFSLQEREEYCDLYGDTDEIINMYEKILEEHKIKIKKTK